MHESHKKLPALLALFFALLLLVLPAAGQEGTDPVVSANVPQELFRIGYLRRETTGHPREEFLVTLKKSLSEDSVIQRRLLENGYGGIGLYPCDGPADMVRRLNLREFDLAFTPANLYARQDAGYSAILKSRRPGDLMSPTGRVWRQGVVFVTPRSPLFHDDEITSGEMQRVLARERLAVVSTQSVAGFQAPLLRLSTDFGVSASEGGYLWFDNSEEVVKGVISGLADIGACEESALIRVLEEAGLAGRREEIAKVILRTDRITTDPVVVHEKLSPRSSALGREIRDAIREYSLGGGFGQIQYTPANDQEYGSLIELQKEFTNRVGEVEQ